MGREHSIIIIVLLSLIVSTCCFTMSAKAEEKKSVVSKTIRFVTAYNVGIEAQTDDTPCIGAANTNLCEAVDRGELHCAANFVKLGTKLHISKVGTCTVTDRMNRRYKNRVDIAMPKSKYKEALKFGKQKLWVSILK